MSTGHDEPCSANLVLISVDDQRRNRDLAAGATYGLRLNGRMKHSAVCKDV